MKNLDNILTKRNISNTKASKFVCLMGHLLDTATFDSYRKILECWKDEEKSNEGGKSKILFRITKSAQYYYVHEFLTNFRETQNFALDHCDNELLSETSHIIISLEKVIYIKKKKKRKEKENH